MTYHPCRTTNTFFLSPSLHHIHQRQRTRLANGSRSSSTTAFPRLPLPNIHSSSQTSMNCHLKEVDLSEEDFRQLKEALQTLFTCTRRQKRCDWQQRLTSPYLQSRSNNHNRFSSPLYTDEHFIRKGLWNHNDGPEIPDLRIQQGNLCYPRHPHLNRCAPSSILSTPLTLVPNQKHLLTAMTSNFTVEGCRRSQSALEVRSIKDGKREGDQEQTETNSTRIRRKKVQAWERENLLQHSQSMTSSTAGESLTKKSLQSAHKSHASLAICTPTVVKVASADQNIDHLFPMVKVLGTRQD